MHKKSSTSGTHRYNTVSVGRSGILKRCSQWHELEATLENTSKDKMEATHVVVFSELSPKTKVQYTRFLLDHDVKVLLRVSCLC